MEGCRAAGHRLTSSNLVRTSAGWRVTARSVADSLPSQQAVWRVMSRGAAVAVTSGTLILTLTSDC